MASSRYHELKGRPLPWVDYDRADRIFGMLSDNLSHPKQTPMPGLFIAGPDGNGKSALISRFAEIQSARAGRFHPAIVRFEMPVHATESRFYDAVLNAISPRGLTSGSAGEKQVQAHREFQYLRVEMLVIDSFERIFSASPMNRRILVNVIKHIINVTTVSVVVLGRPDSADFLFSNEQMGWRLHQVDLPLWVDDEAFARLHADLERAVAARLGHPPSYADASLRSFNLQLAKGRISAISHLVSLGGELVHWLGRDR